MSNSINKYGDRLVQAGEGHGSDIASQRADDLDFKAVARVKELVNSGRPPKVLDLGSGRGAQAVRMLQAGATRSVAVDREDFGAEFLALVKRTWQVNAAFIQMDLSTPYFAEKLQQNSGDHAFDVIVCQRTVHYLTWSAAAVFLEEISKLLAPRGQLFISASGLGSELGEGYAHADRDASSRFSTLEPGMASKHGILAPVCLYTRNDLIEQCVKAGLHVITAQESAFGNIKVAAEKQ